MTTPEGFVIERCRTEECQAPIVWARTRAGRLMPVDAEPVGESGGGTVWLIAKQGFVRAYVAPDDKLWPLNQDQKAALRTSHFATCQRAADWRRPR